MINDSHKFSDSNYYDIFLAHNYDDKDIIDEFLIKFHLLTGEKYTVFIDWIEENEQNIRKINKTNAEIIKKRMARCKCLLYLTSKNIDKSLWMPWFMGYFDGLKGKVAVVPLSLNENPEQYFSSRDFLGLYPYVGITPDNKNLSIFIPNSNLTFNSLKNWLV